VIGAMVIAPGFEPFLRVPFGLISGTADSVRSLIPAAALVGIAVSTADWDIAGRALQRWAVDAVAVAGAGAVVVGAKHFALHGRRAEP
jgi:uncharacterized membrane protein